MCASPKRFTTGYHDKVIIRCLGSETTTIDDCTTHYHHLHFYHRSSACDTDTMSLVCTWHHCTRCPCPMSLFVTSQVDNVRGHVPALSSSLSSPAPTLVPHLSPRLSCPMSLPRPRVSCACPHRAIGVSHPGHIYESSHGRPRPLGKFFTPSTPLGASDRLIYINSGCFI